MSEQQFRFCGASLSPQGFQNVTEQPNEERKELSGIMCTRCREKHRKCDRQLPGCNRCARAKLPCVYPKRSVQLSGASVDAITSQVTYLKSSLQALETEYYETLMKRRSQMPSDIMVMDNSSDNVDDKSKAVNWLLQHRSSTPSTEASNHGANEGFQDFSAVFIAQDPRTRREHNYNLRIAQTPSGFRIIHNFASTATFLQYLMYTLRREPAPPLQQYYEGMVQSEHRLEISQDDFREILSVLVFNGRPMWKYSGAIGANYRGWANETSLYTSGSLYLNLEGYEDSKEDESVDEAGQIQRRRTSAYSVLPELQRETDLRQQPRMRLLSVPENVPVIISHIVTQYAECVGSSSIHIPSLMRRFWAGKLPPIVVNSICAMYALHTYVTHGANLLETADLYKHKGPDKIPQSIELGRRVERHFIVKTRDLLDDAFDEPHIDTALALFNLCVCFLKYRKPNRLLDPAASEVPPDSSDTPTSTGSSGRNSNHTDKARTYFSMAVSMIRSLTNYDSRGRMVEIKLENKNDVFERESARRILWALVSMDATLNTDPNGTAQWTLMDDCCNDRIRIPGPKVMPDEGEESAMGIAWFVRQFSHEGFVVHRRIAIDLFRRLPHAEGGIWGTEITQTIKVVLQELDEWFNNRPQVLRRWPNRTFETQQCLIHLVQTDLDGLMKKLVVLRGYFGEYGECLPPNKYRDEASANPKSYQKGVYSDPSATPWSTPDLSPYASSLSDFPNTPSGPMRDKSMERQESFDASFQKHPFGEAAAPYTGSQTHPPSHHHNPHQPKIDEAAENARLHAQYIDVAIQACLDVAERFGELISTLACFKSSLIFSMVQCVDILVKYMDLVHQVTERQQLHKLSGVYKPTSETTPSPVLTQITFPLMLSLTNAQPFVFKKIKHTDKPRGVATALRDIADNFRSLRVSPSFGDAIGLVLEKIDGVLSVPLLPMALASVTKDRVEVEVKIESDDEPMFWTVKSSFTPDTVTTSQDPFPGTEATSPTKHVATSESTSSCYLSLMMQESWEPTITLDTDVDVNLLPNLDDLGI
ncbi:hypothetical protein BZG36_04536 [Bifiguratus adelaidae]|uniref:Zn(2)-C6 fungal-type domain-containing protein n=1 Tax=Bifiguratus adelaidae TaxID=1938954 RepID=A0A261XXV8_9FUNG|nr:hypothetical protein BZG36_04536 [Bifiguratus adelaidae]